MKRKTKIITLVIAFILSIGASAISNYEARADTTSADVCSHFVPALNDCTWHPVNCLCPIIVTPKE